MNAAIFDLDGTLIDSMNVWKDADNDFLSRFEIKPDKEYMKMITQATFNEGIDYTIQRYGLNLTKNEVKNELVKLAYNKYANEIMLKDGVKEFLNYLKNKNIKIAMATSCIKEMCEAVLKKNKAIEYFEEIVYADDIKKNKAFPDIYLHAAKKMNTSPRDCVVFEDVPHAAMGAKKAGMKVVGVYDGFSAEHESAMRKICDKYIYNFKELM